MLNGKYKICVRAGIQCAPLVHKKNKTIDTGVVRISLDFFNTYDDIKYLNFALNEIFNT